MVTELAQFLVNAVNVRPTLRESLVTSVFLELLVIQLHTKAVALVSVEPSITRQICVAQQMVLVTVFSLRVELSVLRVLLGITFLNSSNNVSHTVADTKS